jgi:hypothetical protein
MRLAPVTDCLVVGTIEPEAWHRGLAGGEQRVQAMLEHESGEGGIRTLGTLACTPVFETGPIGRSGTSPGAIILPCALFFAKTMICSLDAAR